MNIFNMMDMTLDEIRDTYRDVFAEIVAEEVRASYLNAEKVLPLDYYRHFGRQFDANKWKEATP